MLRQPLKFTSGSLCIFLQDEKSTFNFTTKPERPLEVRGRHAPLR